MRMKTEREREEYRAYERDGAKERKKQQQRKTPIEKKRVKK